MNTFEELHKAQIVGSLTTFDRMIFKGHLTGLFPAGSFERLLSRSNVLLKDFGAFAEGATTEVRGHVQRLAAEAGRPMQYLQERTTKRSGRSKDDVAREIAERDGVTEGLVCVLSVLEPCWSFDVRGCRETHRLRVVHRRRTCLHFYLYLIDREFGWMHVRLQSWFPFTIQLYINGREWLSRDLDREGIGYTRYLNSFQAIDDLPRAQELADRLVRRDLVGVFNHFATLVNPWAAHLRALGFGGYLWVIDQCEGATDIIFQSRRALDDILPDLLAHSTLHFSPDHVLRFLGRKLHPNLQADVITRRQRRPEGMCVKHAFKGNSIKIYDKARVLRIETTINNPREFKVLRGTEDERRWVPMGKGVANLWRYAQVAAQANTRYLDALAQAQLHGEAVRELDRLCQPCRFRGQRFARFEPLRRLDLALFQAVLAGAHLIDGFRNRDLHAMLFPKPPSSTRERRSRCVKVSRLIAKLRAHRLLAKVKDARKYRVTSRGHRILAAVVGFYRQYFPEALLATT